MPYEAVNWYRTPINRELLKKLTAKKNLQPFLHIMALLCISTATGVFAFWAFHNLAWPLVVLAVYVHCTLYGFFGGGTGGHELSHRTVFRSRWLNEFFIRVVGFLTYLNFGQFRGNHTRHHQYTTQPGIDFEVTLPLVFKSRQWIWWFTLNIPGIVKIFPEMFRHCFGSPGGDTRKDIVAFPSRNPKDIRLTRRWSWIILGGHLSLAVVFVLSGNWILIFLVTLAPFIARWFFILTHRSQHIGMHGGVSDWRRNTRTYLAGPFVRFYYWNMNYHIEHHMFAAVPFYHLPALRKAIEYDLPLAPKGLVATWREIFACLKKQKEDPEYFIEPKFPATANLSDSGG